MNVRKEVDELKTNMKAWMEQQRAEIESRFAGVENEVDRLRFIEGVWAEFGLALTLMQRSYLTDLDDAIGRELEAHDEREKRT